MAASFYLLYGAVGAAPYALALTLRCNSMRALVLFHLAGKHIRQRLGPLVRRRIVLIISLFVLYTC